MYKSLQLLRSFIAIVLASVFLLQSASKLLVIANYELNKEYIAKNLCENKAKPKSTCNGKCQLKKQLQKEDKKEKEAPASQKEKSEIQFFSNKLFNFLQVVVSEKETIQISYLFSKSSKHLSGVFHPPQT